MICTYFHFSAGGQGTEWKFHFFCFVLQTSTGSPTWDESVGVLLATPDVLAEVQSGLHPLHAEVEAERDGVILVIDGQDVRNFETLKRSIISELNNGLCFKNVNRFFKYFLQP